MNSKNIFLCVVITLVSIPWFLSYPVLTVVGLFILYFGIYMASVHANKTQDKNNGAIVKSIRKYFLALRKY